MPNRQTQDQQNERLGNPGTFSPDDDEAQAAERTPAGDSGQGGQGRKRQALQDEPGELAGGATDDDSDLDDDEDDDDDEDVEDGSGGHV